MEWSKDKTMKLIELLQVNATLWNPSLCDSRRDKQKRREELRSISEILQVYVADVTRKIQHLRTQYNRESARELRALVENPEDSSYVSSWYAFEYLHFLKDSNKPYRLLKSETTQDPSRVSSQSASLSDCKYINLSPPHKISKTEFTPLKADSGASIKKDEKDDLSLFGEYIANELRSVKGEKSLLMAKKKILDVIFEVKLGNTEQEQSVCTVYTQRPNDSIHSDKVFSPTISSAQIEPLSASHTTPTSGISEIIINSACHYTNFKVDSQ